MTAALLTHAAPVFTPGVQVRIRPGFAETGLLATVVDVAGEQLVLLVGRERFTATTDQVSAAPSAVPCAHCGVHDALGCRGNTPIERLLAPYCDAQCANNADHVPEATWWRRAVDGGAR